MHVVQMAIYTINRVLETPNAQENGIVVFHDLKGLVRNNLDVRIPKMVLVGCHWNLIACPSLQQKKETRMIPNNGDSHCL
jgi:hypothetical protein